MNGHSLTRLFFYSFESNIKLATNTSCAKSSDLLW